MGFQKIGPYDLNRRDLIVAAWIVSFLLASTGTRIRVGLWFLIPLAVLCLGLVFRDPVPCAIGLLGLMFILVSPGLQSPKRVKGICLFLDSDGLVAETDKTRTIYKWATIGPFRKVGPRLFIMVSKGSALMVKDRDTNPENMADLIATLAHHRSV